MSTKLDSPSDRDQADPLSDELNPADRNRPSRPFDDVDHNDPSYWNPDGSPVGWPSEDDSEGSEKDYDNKDDQTAEQKPTTNEQPVEDSEAEASVNDGNSSAKSEGEAQLYKETKQQAIQAAGLAAGNTFFTLRGLGVSRKKSLFGGLGAGVVTLSLFLGVSGTSTTFLATLKDQLMGPKNESASIISTQLQKRRLNFVSKAIKNKALNINTEKYAEKLRKVGVVVEMNGKAIVSIGKEFEGEGGEKVFKKIIFDKKSQKEIAEQINELVGDVFGRELLEITDGAAKESLGRFGGAVTRKKLYNRLGIYQFVDWVRARQTIRAGPEASGELKPIESPRGQLNDAIANQDITNEPLKEQYLTDSRQKEAGIDPEDAASKELAGSSDQMYDEAQELADKFKNANGEQLLVAGEENKEAVLKSAEKVSEALSLGDKTSIQSIRKIFGDIGEKFVTKVDGRLLELVGNGFDLTAVSREGCKASGTIKFINGVRNLMMAYEITRFAINVSTAADNHKAGVDSLAYKLLSLYFAGAAGKSTGLQWMLRNGTIAVSTEGVTEYGTGYADVGVLAVISNFLLRVPGLEPENCKIVNNPLTQVGGTILGGVVAAFSGFTSTGFNMGWALTLTVANEAAFAIGIPLITRAVTHQVITGFENPERAGDALASGMGMLQQMSGMANGALPTVISDYIGLQKQERNYQKYALSKKSVFTRYLDSDNSNSFVNTVALISPKLQLESLGSTGGQLIASVLNPSTMLSSVANTLSNKTEALSVNKQCEDPAVVQHQIATTPYCAIIPATVPILDLDQTEKILKDRELIDNSGEPIGEFEKFVEHCFSGRPNVLRPLEISKEGENDPNDATCIVGVDDPSLAGDIEENIEEGITRKPTKKERFAAWYGYLVDKEVMGAQINDDIGALTGTPEPSGMGGAVNCEGYKKISTGVNYEDIAYSDAIKANCVELKTKCESGVIETEKILCAAFDFDGIYYGNGYSELYSGDKAIPLYGFSANSGNYGLNPEGWIASRTTGLDPKNLLECSGLTSVALYKAYGKQGIGCSGNWTETANPTLFRQLPQSEIRPGDFLTYSFGCNSGGGSGHVAIAASPVNESGDLIVYETNRWGSPVRFNEVNISSFKGGWSRYIGEGAQANAAQ